MVQHMGDTFLILTDLDQLTNYSFMKLSSFLLTERDEVTIASTLTRVDYLNKSYHRNFRIAQLIPWLFLST